MVENAYSYVLGLYLGDGCISELKRTHKLRIFQDQKYQNLIKQHVCALKNLFPDNKVSVRYRNNCAVILVYSCKLLDYFPQHGAGKKHLRKIKLKRWQNKIINKYPWEFLRGLYQSDGCRYINKIKKYRYVNYQFTNKSIDIINLWISVAKKLLLLPRLRYRKNGTMDIFHSKRRDVKILESHFGIKGEKTNEKIMG